MRIPIRKLRITGDDALGLGQHAAAHDVGRAAAKINSICGRSVAGRSTCARCNSTVQERHKSRLKVRWSSETPSITSPERLAVCRRVFNKVGAATSRTIFYHARAPTIDKKMSSL